MSTQELADRCAELGMPIRRSVLANLETRRRTLITVAELLVVAAALGVPPVLLLAPLGRLPEIEALPGRDFEPWAAEQWITGHVRIRDLSGDPIAMPIRWEDDDGTVPLFEQHHQLVRALSKRTPWMLEPSVLAATENELRAVRGRMRELELSPPALPAELEYLDESPK